MGPIGGRQDSKASFYPLLFFYVLLLEFCSLFFDIILFLFLGEMDISQEELKFHTKS